MKGLSFTLIAEIIIVFIAAAVLLSIIKLMSPEFYDLILCRFYQIIQLPFPQFTPPSSQCWPEQRMQRFEVDETNTDTLKENIVKYIMDCWKQADDGKLGRTILCSEILFRRIDNPIKEVDIASLMKAKGHCESLPNNFLDKENVDFDCGDKNKIYWSAGNIQGKDVTVVIKFDAFHHRLEVA